jgi:hypothetical protein
MVEARRIAAELAEDGVHYRGYRVDVIDEYGSTIGSAPVIVGDEANKLRVELKRFRNLHDWTTDKQALQALTRLINEAEERLRKIENPDA